jgi:hypothetical protein
MKIELKKIKYMKTLSEETECFSAELWINDQKRGNVSNRGNGGPHDFDDRKAEVELNEHGKTLPPMQSQYFPEGLPMDGELIVSELLAKHLEEKEYRRWCKTKTVFRLPGDKDGQWRTIKGVHPSIVVHINKNYPEAEILNLRFA